MDDGGDDELEFDGLGGLSERRYDAQVTISQTKDGPWWTQADHILDGEKRRPEHTDYDPSTVFIPKTEWDALTPGMKRYW